MFERSTMALDKMRRCGERDDVRCSSEGYQERSSETWGNKRRGRNDWISRDLITWKLTIHVRDTLVDAERQRGLRVGRCTLAADCKCDLVHFAKTAVANECWTEELVALHGICKCLSIWDGHTPDGLSGRALPGRDTAVSLPPDAGDAASLLYISSVL